MKPSHQKVIQITEEYTKGGGYSKPRILPLVRPRFKNSSFPYNDIKTAPFSTLATNIYRGRCYQFTYLATTSVEDFDRTPLALMLKIEAGFSHFWGLNLHHLQIHELSLFLRQYSLVFPEMGSIRKSPKISQFTNSGIFKRYSNAIRHYKLEGLQSKFYEIDPKYWGTVSLIPSLRNFKTIEN